MYMNDQKMNKDTKLMFMHTLLQCLSGTVSDIEELKSGNFIVNQN